MCETAGIIFLQETEEEDAKPSAPEHVCRTPKSYAGQRTQPPRAWSQPRGDPYGRCECKSLLQIFKLDEMAPINRLYVITYYKIAGGLHYLAKVLYSHIFLKPLYLWCRGDTW